jgi:large subunit ribosomal protein L21
MFCNRPVRAPKWLTACLVTGESENMEVPYRMYALIESGGKQYKVSEGTVLKVEKLEAAAGDRLSIDKVLMVNDENGNVKVGNPLVSNARVEVEVMEQGRDKKVVVFKYKRRKNYRKKQGHRQPFTRIKVIKIEA